MSDKIYITIKTHEGKIEERDVSAKFWQMDDAKFAKIRKSTMDAGRGEPMSYRVVKSTRPDSDIAWDAVMDAQAKVDRSVSQHNPSAVAIAQREYDKAFSDYKTAYPAAYAAKHAPKTNRTEGYKSALAGKD